MDIFRSYYSVISSEGHSTYFVIAGHLMPLYHFIEVHGEAMIPSFEKEVKTMLAT